MRAPQHVRFEVVELAESAGTFHGRSLPEPAVPQIWWNRSPTSALVLGSTQRDMSIVDAQACAAANVDVVRRRSGGGAVLLVAGDYTWIDVILPTGSPGWSDDVHGPMVWLGQHFAEVIHDLLGSDPNAAVSVHEGAMVHTKWSRLLCFDGVGPGEVLLGGQKLVGISQRRSRTAARLQCSWYSRYDSAAMTSLLSPSIRPPVSELSPVATLDRHVSDRIPALLCERLNRVA